MTHDPWCHFPPRHPGPCSPLGVGPTTHSVDCPMYPDPIGTCTQQEAPRRAVFWRRNAYPEWLTEPGETIDFGVKIVDQWYDRMREIWVVLVTGPTLPFATFGTFPYMFQDEYEMRDWCKARRDEALWDWIRNG